jgi:hypothetical protein
LQTQTSGDGLYYVMSVNHIGDMRGTDWYSDLTCLSVDATITQEQTSKTLIVPQGNAQAIQRYGQ